ncbi:MAG: FtsX-like permease family protein [Deferrisomatales bacterium]|nr:FtsX-like permease family protein [Deferrisomatales bacterium]
MNASRLVLRNMTRRRGRLVLTLLGITVGIASLVTFLSLGASLQREIRREAHALGADLVVAPKGSCAYEQVSILTGDQLPVTITMDEVRTIAALPGLTAVPLLTEKSAIRNRPVPVAGTDLELLSELKGWRLAQGRLPRLPDQPGLLAGSAAAKDGGLGLGDTVTIRGQALPVLGILAETRSRDDTGLFLPLELAQELFGVGDRVSFVAVQVDDVSRTGEHILAIREATALGVVSDEQMLQSVLSVVGTVSFTVQLIAAVAVLAAAFGIVNTMLTATYERRREIGILQALGARRGTIFRLFLVESGCYGVLGGLIGVAAGALASIFLAPHVGQNAFTAFVKGSAGGLDPTTAAGSVLFSLAVALVAGTYPAWKAAGLAPVEAIRYE